MRLRHLKSWREGDFVRFNGQKNLITIRLDDNSILTAPSYYFTDISIFNFDFQEDGSPVFKIGDLKIDKNGLHLNKEI